MRNLLIAALLAGAANPVLAAADEPSDRRAEARAERAERAQVQAERKQPRPQRSESSEDRAERAEPDKPRVTPIQRPQIRGQRVERTAEPRGVRGAPEPRMEPSIPVRNAPAPRVRVQREVPEQRESVRGSVRDSVRDWRAGERQRADSPSSIEQRNLRRAPPSRRSGDALVEQTRPLPRVIDRDPVREARRTPTFGTQAPEPATARIADARPAHRWRTDWRRDRRFDWSNHRRRNRSFFRLAFYIDPFGWNYHRYGIGWRMWPSHYSNRYWLSDPWSYRLPPAYGPYRWVRYWDDALLVNIYTGQVVDVVHDFFW